MTLIYKRYSNISRLISHGSIRFVIEAEGAKEDLRAEEDKVLEDKGEDNQSNKERRYKSKDG